MTKLEVFCFGAMSGHEIYPIDLWWWQQQIDVRTKIHNKDEREEAICRGVVVYDKGSSNDGWLWKPIKVRAEISAKDLKPPAKESKSPAKPLRWRAVLGSLKSLHRMRRWHWQDSVTLTLHLRMEKLLVKKIRERRELLVKGLKCAPS